MINIQLPGRLVAGDKTSFGGPYPLKDYGTGLNNYDCNSYPNAVNDRIWPVANPLDPARPVCISYEVRPGDRQPHYPGSSGERAELWYEPHDGVVGTRDAVVSSWVIPPGWQSPGGWCIVLQNHNGENSPSLSPWFTVNLLGGKISVSHHHDEYVFGTITPGREFFFAVDTFLSSGADGFARVWMSWDTPPDTTQAPSVSWTGDNQQGTPMWWKTGLYRNPESFSNRVIQTTLARRPSMADAVVAAGWPQIGGVVPPPLPTNAELRDQAVAALKATTVSYPVWKAKLDAGSYPDPSKTKWQQAFDLLAKIK